MSSFLSALPALLGYLVFVWLAFRLLFWVLRTLRMPIFSVGIFAKVGPFLLRTRR